MTHKDPTPPIQTEFTQISTAFREARGSASDEQWARSAQARLFLDVVNPEIAQKALTDLIPLLQEADESAEDLFGSAYTWAHEQQRIWRENGVQAYMRDEPFSLWSFLSTAFTVALWVSVLTTIVTLVDDGWTTEILLPMAFLPFGIAIMGISTRQVWQFTLRKFSRPWALAAVGAFLLIAGITLGGITIASKEVSFGITATLWLLTPVPIYALLARASHSLASRSRRPIQATPSSPTPDNRWGNILVEQLRLRKDLSETEIQRVLSEAQDHALEAESSLYNEFGSPENYAARFAPNTRSKARFEALGWTAGMVLAAGLSWLSISTEGAALTWKTLLYGALFLSTLLYAVAAWHRSVSPGRNRDSMP